MAGYSAGEALALTQLKNVTGNPAPWSASNTSRGDWGILNSGKSDHYGVLKPGGDAQIEGGGYSLSVTTWSTIIEVWQRYKDDGTTLTSLEALSDAILTRFKQYRKLGDTGGTIADSSPTLVSVPKEMWQRGGNGPSWLMQEITITWKEEEKVTYAE